MLLVDYAKIWSNDLNTKRIEEYRTSIIGTLKLKHLVHFYEILEEKTLEIVLKHVDKKYANDAPQLFLTTGLDETIKYFGGNISQLQIIIGRFALRYLRQPSPLEIDKKLSEYKDLFRFPVGKNIFQNDGEESFKDQWNDIYVNQTGTILNELNRRIYKEEEERLSRSLGRQPTQSSQIKQSASFSKKSNARNLGKYSTGN